MDSRSASGELTSCHSMDNVDLIGDTPHDHVYMYSCLYSVHTTQPFVEIDIFAHINTNMHS